MPHPTLTWTVHAPQNIAAAGASPTIPEMLAALKAAVDTAAAGTGKFEVADYNAGAGTLVLKRKGSPSGELATMRIIIFGGGSPHASAIRGGGPAGQITFIYGGLVIDPVSGTAPDASYTAGSPYPGKKYTRATCWGANMLTAAAARVAIFDCEDAFGCIMYDADGSHVFYAGKLVHRLSDDTLLWGAFGQGNSQHTTSIGADWFAIANTYPIPGYDGSGTYSGGATYWDGSAARCCGRMSAGGIQQASVDPYTAPTVLILSQVLLGDCTQATSQTPQLLGYLRQIRMGPKAVNLAYLRDSLGVLQARHIGPGDGVQAWGIWLDNVP